MTRFGSILNGNVMAPIEHSTHMQTTCIGVLFLQSSDRALATAPDCSAVLASEGMVRNRLHCSDTEPTRLSATA